MTWTILIRIQTKNLIKKNPRFLLHGNTIKLVIPVNLLQNASKNRRNYLGTINKIIFKVDINISTQ